MSTLDFSPIFSPNIEVELPADIIEGVDELAIPSAFDYYLNFQGEPVPHLRQPNDQLSAKVWYTLEQDFVFPLKTIYAEARPDQVNLLPSRRMPPSEIAWSLKTRQKQYPDENSQLESDFFEFLVNQTRTITVDQLLRDIYRFPVNPSVNIFEVAKLLEHYIRTGHEDDLRRYLEDLDIISLKDHSFGYYPIYELFFLLTRFASYPLSQAQIRLAHLRNQTVFDSPARRFIDAIFHLQITDLESVLTLVERIQNEGPESVGLELGTPFPDWVNWADEYLQLIGTDDHTGAFVLKHEPLDVGYVGAPVNQTSPSYYTWTDLELVQLMEEAQLDLPDRSQFLNRYDWVENIASLVKRYRSGAESNNQYGLRK